MNRQRLTLVLSGLLPLIVILSGCGSSGGSSEATTANIAYPRTPSAADCGFGHPLPSDTEPPRKLARPLKAPMPGIYRYDTTGTEVIRDSGIRVKNLPRQTEMVVTPAHRDGELTCYSSQARFAKGAADTTTYVLRGENAYMTALHTNAFNETEEVIPSPAVLAINGTGSTWSDRFTGATRGRYMGTTLGLNFLQVGKESVPVIGVKAEVEYAGVVTETRQTTTWLSSDSVIVSQVSIARQAFGISHTESHVEMRLESLKPQPLSRQ
jgi:hypothetical protein